MIQIVTPASTFTRSLPDPPTVVPHTAIPPPLRVSATTTPLQHTGVVPSSLCQDLRVSWFHGVGTVTVWVCGPGARKRQRQARPRLRGGADHVVPLAARLVESWQSSGAHRRRTLAGCPAPWREVNQRWAAPAACKAAIERQQSRRRQVLMARPRTGRLASRRARRRSRHLLPSTKATRTRSSSRWEPVPDQSLTTTSSAGLWVREPAPEKTGSGSFLACAGCSVRAPRRTARFIGVISFSGAQTSVTPHARRQGSIRHSSRSAADRNQETGD